MPDRVLKDGFKLKGKGDGKMAITVEIVADGASNEWLETVSDEEYSKLK